MASRPERFLVPILFVLIFLVGVIGNGALVFFFFKYPQMRNVPNTYILSLASGDILVLLFTVPFVSIVFTLEDYPFGEIVCKMQEIMKDISIGVTVFTLTALSVNRYYAIVHTFNQRSDGMKHTLLVTAFIWIFSILLSVPAGIFTSLRTFGKSNSETLVACYPFPEFLGPFYPQFSVLFKFLVYYFIPLMIISTYYILMARHLMTQDIPGECLPQQRTTHQRQAASRRKVAKMVLAFVLIFAVCFFPNNVFMMWFYFHPTAQDDYNYTWNSVRIIGFCLAFINSCINPIALYWISGTFRKHFNRHLFFCIRHDDCNVQSLSQYHFQSSTRIYANVKTENFEISSENGLDKVT
ncbi:G protein-coupled receptor rhodopsin-like, partial [Trinorchestia longiramus]